ncbi:hypothetical protein EYC84_008327 [Monilinia fructicola]|uniref:Uncharacterized protein n=1 Tax=Monilinia fructicola TaxID=38448 RepID=A0A5M9JIR8_MONFR|nr:hypothetical protein EYC84_008327 [Monilinia fructicola]
MTRFTVVEICSINYAELLLPKLRRYHVSRKRLPGWIQKTALTRCGYTRLRARLACRIELTMGSYIRFTSKWNPIHSMYFDANLTVDGHAVKVEAHEFRGSPEIDTAISCCGSSSLPSQHQRTQ